MRPPALAPVSSPLPSSLYTCMQGAHTTPRLIAMSVPAANVFLPLSDSSVLIGFGAASPLQVWDLELGTKTRDLEGEYELCASLASLSGGRIAAACRRNGDWFVEIHDLGSGQRIQELDCTDVARGLAYTNGHLLCASESPGKLWVFRDSPSGQVSRSPRGSTQSLAHCRPLTPTTSLRFALPL